MSTLTPGMLFYVCCKDETCLFMVSFDVFLGCVVFFCSKSLVLVVQRGKVGEHSASRKCDLGLELKT